MRGIIGGAAMAAVVMTGASAATARTCEQLRTLCHGMRDDKADCVRPYQRCLKTGVFVTPLGRVFRATQ